MKYCYNATLSFAEESRIHVEERTNILTALGIWNVH